MTDSGREKRISVSPCSLVRNAGRKKAVSAKSFRRAARAWGFVPAPVLSKLSAMAFWPAAVVAQNEITVYDEGLGRNEMVSLPEGMLVTEIDSMMRHWSSKAYLTYDGTDCKATDEVVRFEPEVYAYRLGILPNVVEMRARFAA